MWLDIDGLVTNLWSPYSAIIMWSLNADKREGGREAMTAACGQDNITLSGEGTRRLLV